MARPYDATNQLLDERPELESVLDALVDVDADGPWTFEDADCDSGTFGEIVSREFVESVDDGYQLVDKEATRAAIDGETFETTEKPDQSGQSVDWRTLAPAVRSRIRSTFAGISRTFLVTATLSVLFLIVMRVIRYREVFRGEHVVLPGNDPYLYRHTVDRLLAASPGLFRPGEIATVLGGRATGEPLSQVVGWWLTAILQGNPETSGAVIAVLPVISTLLVGLLVAWMALTVTRDERIAALAIVALAVTPAHALYSGLGFYDHSALDYLWLASMAAALVWLARDYARRETARAHVASRRTWVVATLFGVACSAAMLNWNGAPILLSGIVLYAVWRPLADLRADNSPLSATLPLSGGLLVATLCGHLLHAGAGWQEAEVVYVPGLIAIAALAVGIFTEAVFRSELDARLGTAGISGFILALAGGVYAFAPGFVQRYQDRFFEDLLGRESIAETRGLFVPELGVSFGPLEQYGLLLVFGLPALGYLAYYCIREYDPAWLVLVSFALPLLGFASIQRRFAGELSVFVAIFAATGLVWALSRAGLCRSAFTDNGPTRLRFQNVRGTNQALSLSLVVLVVVTVGLIFTVGIMGSVTISDEEYEAAAWIDDNADESSVVLSRWGRYRMYNYFAGSDDMGYGFARNNYRPFLESGDPDGWYDELGTVDYVVVQDFNLGLVQANSTYARLTQALGSATDQTEGVGHYQFAYLTQGQSFSVFRPVEGALIEGIVTPGETITVQTQVEFDDRMASRIGGESFAYRRVVTAGENGTFTVRVAYPGTYSIGNQTVEVTDSDVRDGNRIQVDDSE